MAKITLDNVTDEVIAALGQNGDIDARQREIMTSLITHLHGFCKDVKLQHHEFIAACQYLARAGAVCDGGRQEFILLSDILGVEVLVDHRVLRDPAGRGAQVAPGATDPEPAVEVDLGEVVVEVGVVRIDP